MVTYFSRHAKQRFESRFWDVPVTLGDIYQAVTAAECQRFPVGKTWILVKSLDRVYKADGSHGSQVWVIVSRSCDTDPGAISTICLRERWQQPQRGAYVIRP